MGVFTPDDLGAIPLFEVLSECQRELLLDRHRTSRHQVDQVIVMEQDWGESLFLIRDGLAKVRTYTADGEEVIMSLLGPGDVFGELAALAGHSRSADVVALTSLELIKMRATSFTSLLTEEALFALALARLEAGRLRDLNQRFAVQTADATTRLLDALAYLARRNSGGVDPLAEIPPLAQREVALLAGLARETASRTLSKLRSRGTVTEENGRLRIVDAQPLIKRGLLVG